jgi:hypothetical protein
MERRPGDDLAGSRLAFERSLEEVKSQLDSELGRRPRRRGWILATVAGAAGLALAWRVSALYRRPGLTRGERPDEEGEG